MNNTLYAAVLGEKLSLQYPRTAAAAVREADFSVPPGAVCWIIGPNGSGKSSLGLAAGGMLPGIVPGKRRGLVRVMGKDPAELEPRERVETCAYIFQDPSAQLCTLSVESELSLLLENRGISPEEIELRIWKIMEEFAISHLAGRDLITLSGGEKQMVALAAAVTLTPDVLILDEPCSYLDTENRATVLNMLRAIKKNHHALTLLVVEHRTDGLPEADVILSVDAGRVSSLEVMPAVWGSDFPRIGKSGDEDMFSSPAPLLSIRNLDFAYKNPGGHSGSSVLRGLNMTLGTGECVVLEGRNGSGKSTLLNLIASVLAKTKLKGRFSGDIRWTDPDAVPNDVPGVFMVPQNPEHLFIRASVLDELLQASGDDRESARAALSEFDLNGYEERNPYTLSSGQKRRLNLAAASLSFAPLILLDEPTFGLDGPGVKELIGLILRLRNQGRTLLVVTHDRAFADAAADRILYLQDGKVLPHTINEQESMGSALPVIPDVKKEVKPSLLGKRNPLVRAAAALLIIIGAGFVSSLEATLTWLAVGTIAALMFTSLTPAGFLKKIIPFALIGAGFLWANLLFHRSGGIASGFNTGILLFCRSLVFGIYSLTFVEDLDPERFSHSLMHYLKMPPKLVYALMIAFRIGPELKAEGAAIRQATGLRTQGRPGKKGIIPGLKREFQVYFGIFVAAFRRAGRIAVAMDGRGLDNTPRHLHKAPPFMFADVLLFLGSCTVLVLPLIFFGLERWNSAYF